MFEDFEAGDGSGPDLPPDRLGSAADWAVPGVDRPTPVPAPVVLPAVVVALQEAVAGLAGWQPSDLDGPQALVSVQALLECERALAAARTRSLSDMEARRLHHLDGAPSTGRWLTRHGHQLPAPPRSSPSPGASRRSPGSLTPSPPADSAPRSPSSCRPG